MNSEAEQLGWPSPCQRYLEQNREQLQRWKRPEGEEGVSTQLPSSTIVRACRTFPMLPDGVRPRPPIRPAHMSDRMSPYKLGMTMTLSAYGLGSCTICGKAS
jgi:hypothetical protein